MRQRGDGLQAQVGQFGRLLILDAAEQPVLGTIFRRRFLDAYLLGVGDDDVEAAAPGDRDLLVAVAGESELQARSEGFVEARRQETLIGHICQLPQRTENRLAWCKDQGVFDEWAVGIFEGKREFGGDDAAHEDGFARAHGQRQYVARIVERQRFAQAFQTMLLDERIVRRQALQQGIQTFVSNQRDNLRRSQAHGCASVAQRREQKGIEVADTRRIQYQSQIPVGLQCAKLGATQVAQLPAFFLGVLKNFADRREFLAEVVLGPPSVDALGKSLE